ncbi:MAG: ATP-dependent Clp protease adaptor ClpS [Spirochaetia bacterium]|uniref:ATP-dependent Clp protease adaptor ClpS n=1 Tax=Treponema sp. TaxID=166 RepID=UPI00298D8152|nr:ATP-dependent Clp protease adaptor ClpS [Treponema sp.]MCI7398313.1 ATP-dependent Clp protease adaptor ClpS [Spirochaetia bacterium]MCI7576912.1 ATP-dependent Clp protease adaptor ClpS [Spirochaetia bacterium]
MPENKYSDQTDSDVEVEFDVPPQYKVVLFNDDYTTMEFVVEILMVDFNKTFEEASAVMLEVHKSGKGIAGIYPYDIAATKARSAQNKARAAGFPLQITVEED